MKQQLKPLHLICVEDELEPNKALISIKDGIASASNFWACIKLDLRLTSSLEQDQIDMLNGKYIHKEVWREIFKCDVLEFDDIQIICHKKGIKRTFDYSAGTESFVIDNAVLDVKSNGSEPKTEMCFNRSQLKIIGEIFQEPNLNFSFSKGGVSTVVFPYEDSGMFALATPVISSQTNARYFFL